MELSSKLLCIELIFLVIAGWLTAIAAINGNLNIINGILVAAVISVVSMYNVKLIKSERSSEKV